jgi:DNA-binding CsgD family transcriptional regulator
VAYVSARDYERILTIVAESASGTAAEPLPAHVLDMIRRLIPSDVVALVDGPQWDWPNRREWVSGWFPPWSDEDQRIIGRYRSQMFLGPSPASIHGPLRISDSLSLAGYHRTDLYQLVGRGHGVEHSMEYWLPGHAGRIWGLSFDASRHDFSDRDRDVLAVLGRHLATVIERFDARLPPASARRILTSRQAEILALVADGRTNGQIGQALSISSLTVKKHLENAFFRLGVRSRAAAIASLYAQAGSRSRNAVAGSTVGDGLEPAR